MGVAGTGSAPPLVLDALSATRLPPQGLTNLEWKSCYLPHFTDRKMRHRVVSSQTQAHV